SLKQCSRELRGFRMPREAGTDGDNILTGGNVIEMVALKHVEGDGTAVGFRERLGHELSCERGDSGQYAARNGDSDQARSSAKGSHAGHGCGSGFAERSA